MRNNILKERLDGNHSSNDQQRSRRRQQQQTHVQAVAQARSKLQDAVNALLDNEGRDVVQSVDRKCTPLRALMQRLKGKHGRIRGSLQGKRTEFSSRSVISADPDLPLEAVGVPQEIAMVQSWPERVRESNRNCLQQLVTNGPWSVDGANTVIKRNGVTHNLRFASESLQLSVSSICVTMTSCFSTVNQHCTRVQ